MRDFLITEPSPEIKMINFLLLLCLLLLLLSSTLVVLSLCDIPFGTSVKPAMSEGRSSTVAYRDAGDCCLDVGGVPGSATDSTSL